MCPLGRGRNRLGGNNMFAEWVHMGQKAEPGLQKQKPIWFPAPLSQRGRKPRLGFTPRGGRGWGGRNDNGAAQLVSKVRAAINIRFQSGDHLPLSSQIVARVFSSSKVVALLLSTIALCRSMASVLSWARMLLRSQEILRNSRCMRRRWPGLVIV